MFLPILQKIGILSEPLTTWTSTWRRRMWRRTRTRTRTKTRENTRATPYFNIGRKMKKDLRLDFCAKKTIKKLSIELINSD